ncbi:hypothetical protein ACSZOL_23040, partial [Aeromonas hydrophila]|uniref:hypothetical protein n=1 Tax=Aeromonas hydrophila TaxID=644 RepID=UPI003EC8F476
QPEASSPGAKDENTGAGLCRSRLVVQERLGHYISVGLNCHSSELIDRNKNPPVTGDFCFVCLARDGGWLKFGLLMIMTDYQDTFRLLFYAPEFLTCVR